MLAWTAVLRETVPNVGVVRVRLGRSGSGRAGAIRGPRPQMTITEASSLQGSCRLAAAAAVGLSRRPGRSDRQLRLDRQAASPCRCRGHHVQNCTLSRTGDPPGKRGWPSVWVGYRRQPLNFAQSLPLSSLRTVIDTQVVAGCQRRRESAHKRRRPKSWHKPCRRLDGGNERWLADPCQCRQPP
jgi:hypothetical protein